jgi:hypothetical protein
MESAFRDVALPDGVLAFRIPAHWREGEEADGTRTFHDDGADTGVLRVKLFTFTSEQQVGPREARRQLEAMAPAPGQRLEELPSGAALRTHREQAEAGGERAVMHTWLLARADPPHRLRLAVFSLAIPRAHAQDPDARRVVRDIDREVRAARLADAVH